MNWCILLWTFISLLQYARGGSLEVNCITRPQLTRALKISCFPQRGNKTLWNEIIACHVPISDEFMRSSAEALCPVTKHVEDPTDTRYSMAEVFFNICGFADPDEEKRKQSGLCLANGTPTICSHEEEVKAVRERWGEDVPCNISKCILSLGLDLGD